MTTKRVIAILNKNRNESVVFNNMKNLYKNKSEDTKVLFFTSDILLHERTLSNNNIPEEILFEQIVPLIECDNISKVNNAVIKKAKEIAPDVEFIHIFHDDLIINEKVDIEKYEKFMDEYQLGYYFNPRLSPLNYVFEKVAPRLVIETVKYAEANVNVYAFDSKEHIIINCKKNNELFNEDVKYLYNIEYIYRCQKTGIVPFLNFYFDNSLFDGDIVRDDKNFPRTPINQQLYSAEEQQLAEVYKVNWVPHSNADEVINYFKRVKNI